ncbi:MAG: thermonuclease family protein [Myxococcota bacterium]
MRLCYVFGMALTGCALGLLLACGPMTEDEDLSPTPTPEPTAEPETPTVEPLSPAARQDCSNGRRLTVGYVVDGDTLEVEQGERIRLVGVDTPETWGEVECFGPEAKGFTVSQVEGQGICLTYDPAVTADSNNIDLYGRTLGYVFYGEGFAQFLNGRLVGEGYAYDYPYTDGAYYERYLAELESEARAASRGLWGTCY